MIDFDTSVHTSDTSCVRGSIYQEMRETSRHTAAVRCIRFRSSEVLPFRAIPTVWALPLRLVRIALLLPVLSSTAPGS